MASEHNYIYYGTPSSSLEIDNLLTHIITANRQAEEKGRKKRPLCIWGRHGIGKTELIENFAQENGHKFCYLAPAQFEEMGDLVGMPKIFDLDPDRIDDDITKLVPPDWVPTSDGPGIMLIDDVNRADDRILRGIMQLLQNYELISWKLPPDWHIVLTANPDGGDYSVTPMDNAMITRMMHVTMKFDVDAWAKWAEGRGIDPRGINFVLTYPEVITGERTTPRSLVHFFEAISTIDNLSQEIDMVKMLGDSCLDDETVITFISFVRQSLSQLISPQEILDASNFEQQVTNRIKSIVEQEVKRLDMLSVICTRLLNYVTVNEVQLKPKQSENLIAFLQMEVLPNDLRLTIAQDMVNSGNKSLMVVMTVPALAKLLLNKM